MSEEAEDRDRMIGNALSLILAASRGNHIVHDACLEVDAEIRRLRAEKNGAYSERNQVVAALAKLFPSGVLHDESDPEWWIVYIDLPTGQVSWHFQTSELPLLDAFPKYEGQWDGHTTGEKYARLAALRPESRP